MTVGGDITCLKTELMQKHSVSRCEANEQLRYRITFACIRVISVYYLEPTSLNILKIIPPSLISFEVQTRKTMTAASQETSFWQRYNRGVPASFVNLHASQVRLHKTSKLKPTSLCKSCTPLSEFDWLIADYYNVWERMFLFEKDTGKCLGFCESIWEMFRVCIWHELSMFKIGECF